MVPAPPVREPKSWDGMLSMSKNGWVPFSFQYQRYRSKISLAILLGITLTSPQILARCLAVNLCGQGQQLVSFWSFVDKAQVF